MLVDLVQTTTSDGLRLDGAWQQATGETTAEPGPFDAVLLVHGTGGNFYSSTLLAYLAEQFLAAGVSALRVNTRGRDLVSTAAAITGSRRQGAAFENLSDCRFDLTAWLDFLTQRGARRIGLVGHSSGAVKSLYSQWQAPHAAVAGLVALSPPRLDYDYFIASPQRETFLEQFDEANELVKGGRGDALLSVRFPLPYIISASGYVEKYGPDRRYNLLNFIGQLAAPTLATFGGLEIRHNPAFTNLPDAITQVTANRVPVATIDGADHFYTGCWTELVGRIRLWMRTLAY